MSSAYGMHDERLGHAPPGSAQRKGKKGKKQDNTSEGGEGGSRAPPPARGGRNDAAPAADGNGQAGGSDFGTNSGAIGMTVQTLTLCSVIMQFLVFLLHTIHLLNGLDDCKQSDTDKKDDDDGIVCFGEALFWENRGLDYKTYNSNLNQSWRNVFTFRPDEFADNWTPAIFFVLAVLQLASSMRFSLLYQNYLANAVFHLVMLLFAALGYAGKFGVAAGMVQAMAGFADLVAMVLAEPGVCYFTIFG